MRFSNLSLSLRVPLIAAGLMVVLGVVASQLVLSALGSVQDARMRELARLHVEGLAVALGPSVLRRDVWEVYDTLDRATSAMDVQRMVLTVVADEAGRVIAASDPRRAPVDSEVAPLLKDAQALGSITVTGNSPHIRVSAPLIYQGREVGTIVSELDVTDLVAERRQAWLYLLAGNALATGVLALGAYLTMRRMLRPVATLASHMAGATGTPMPIPTEFMPKGDTELGRLFQTYNVMSGAAEAKSEAERRLADRERFVSLGRLSSSLAHEINNPLGGLLNATDTIRTYADRPDVVRESADLLDRGLRHLRDVARATLEQNRLDRTGMPLTLEDFDDLKLLFEPETVRLKQRLVWQVGGNAQGLVDFAAAPVRQIALNLLLNASAAAAEGGKVEFEAHQTGGSLILKISDSGPGIADAALIRLMTSDVVQPGGGVGLRLVRDMVVANAGTVGYARQADQSEITVSLPRRQVTAC